MVPTATGPASPRQNAQTSLERSLETALQGMQLAPKVIVRKNIGKKTCLCRFGVCCVFVIQTGSSAVTENCTYIQNEGFPSALSSTNAVSYTVNKISSGKSCWTRRTIIDLFYSFTHVFKMFACCGWTLRPSTLSAPMAAATKTKETAWIPLLSLWVRPC